MKISVNDQHLFTLSETQKKVIMNDIPSDIFDEDMKRRLHYILTHKYERCFERLKKEWLERLIQKEIMIPKDPDAFAQLVFAQPEYQDRKTRDPQTPKLFP